MLDIDVSPYMWFIGAAIHYAVNELSILKHFGIVNFLTISQTRLAIAQLSDYRII